MEYDTARRAAWRGESWCVGDAIAGASAVGKPITYPGSCIDHGFIAWGDPRDPRYPICEPGFAATNRAGAAAVSQARTQHGPIPTLLLLRCVSQARLRSLAELAQRLSRKQAGELKQRAADVQKRHVELSHRLLHASRSLDALEGRLAAGTGTSYRGDAVRAKEMALSRQLAAVEVEVAQVGRRLVYAF